MNPPKYTLDVQQIREIVKDEVKSMLREFLGQPPMNYIASQPGKFERIETDPVPSEGFPNHMNELGSQGQRLSVKRPPSRIFRKIEHQGVMKPNVLPTRKECPYMHSTKVIDVVPSQRKFSRLNQPPSEIFQRLEKHGILKPEPAKSQPNPNAPNYHPNTFCHFHLIQGHHTDDCIRLKHEIQDLIDEGYQIEEDGKAQINEVALESNKCMYCLNHTEPLSKIFERLEEQGSLEPTTVKMQPNPDAPNHDPNACCEFHQQNRHHMDYCTRLKHEIRVLVNEGRILDPEVDA